MQGHSLRPADADSLAFLCDTFGYLLTAVIKYTTNSSLNEMGLTWT